MHARPRPHDAQTTTTTAATSLHELTVTRPVIDPILLAVTLAGMVMGKKSRKVDGVGAARCRRHRQLVGAGVCPLCLRERLGRLSLSESRPSVVARDEEEDAASSSCSDYSEAASSTEGSTGASSASASGSASPGFHREMRRGSGARPSLLMRHERVVAADGDEVVAVLRRRRRERTSFWTKLLRATTGGGGRKEEDRCSVAHSKTLEVAERSAATKWILF